MKTSNKQPIDVRDAVPVGFTLEPQGKDAFVIRHIRTGMGCLNFFLIVWLSGWTVGCVFLLRYYLGGGVMDDGDPIPLWFVAVFWGAEIFAATLLTYLLFCRKLFLLDRENLIMETDILGFKRRKTIPKRSIRRLVQVKDGGKGKDSFPSWGLRVEGEKKINLIFRQPYDKSRWLGLIVAQWADVDFIEVPKK